jgi:hypothetical protein
MTTKSEWFNSIYSKKKKMLMGDCCLPMMNIVDVHVNRPTYKRKQMCKEHD